MDEKIYDPKTIESEIKQARWTLFTRISATVCLWFTVVILFAVLITLP